MVKRLVEKYESDPKSVLVEILMMLFEVMELSCIFMLQVILMHLVDTHMDRPVELSINLTLLLSRRPMWMMWWSVWWI